MKSYPLYMLLFSVLLFVSCSEEDVQPFIIEIDGDEQLTKPFGYWEDWGGNCWQSRLRSGQSCIPSHDLLVFAVSDGTFTNGWVQDYTYVIFSYLYIPVNAEWSGDFEINTWDHWYEAQESNQVNLVGKRFGVTSLYLNEEVYTDMTSTGKISLKQSPGPVLDFTYEVNVLNTIDNGDQSTVTSSHVIKGRSGGSFNYGTLDPPIPST